VQRRRRRKAEPRNVFGTGSSSSKPSASQKRKRPPLQARPIPKVDPPTAPGAKPKIEVEAIPVTEQIQIPETQSEEVEEKISEPEPTDIPLEVSDDTDSQASEKISKTTLGLRKKKTEPSTQETVRVTQPKSTSEKARELIENSLLRAAEVKPIAEKKEVPASPPAKPEIKKKPTRKFRNKNSSYQPAARARRLDRSRHMEYKYEMRGVLSDIGVPDEYRSLLLATIWARGERQTVTEAKEFLVEKFEEGVINDEQHQTLLKIIDGYTVRR
jgi:hypothetical protein